MKKHIFSEYLINMSNTYILEKINNICEENTITISSNICLEKYCFKTLHTLEKEYNINDKNTFLEIISSFVDTQISKFIFDISLENNNISYTTLLRKYCPIVKYRSIYLIDTTDLNKYSIKDLQMFLCELGSSYISGNKSVLLKRTYKLLKKYKINSKQEKVEILKEKHSDITDMKTIWVMRSTGKIHPDYIEKNNEKTIKYKLDEMNVPNCVYLDTPTELKFEGIIYPNDDKINYNVNAEDIF